MLTYIECGRILNTHGVRGAVKVEPWCDSPKVFTAFHTVYLLTKGNYRPVKVVSCGVHGKFILLSLEGVEDVATAIPLKGEVLYVTRDQIPLKDGAMLLADMIGLPVVDATTGVTYGTLTEVEDAAAGMLYYIKTPQGEVILPAVPAFIKEVSPEGVLVTPIPGFFHEV